MPNPPPALSVLLSLSVPMRTTARTGWEDGLWEGVCHHLRLLAPKWTSFLRTSTCLWGLAFEAAGSLAWVWYHHLFLVLIWYERSLSFEIHIEIQQRYRCLSVVSQPLYLKIYPEAQHVSTANAQLNINTVNPDLILVLSALRLEAICEMYVHAQGSLKQSLMQ